MKHTLIFSCYEDFFFYVECIVSIVSTLKNTLHNTLITNTLLWRANISFYIYIYSTIYLQLYFSLLNIR